jgi:hypothetical protein
MIKIRTHSEGEVGRASGLKPVDFFMPFAARLEQLREKLALETSGAKALSEKKDFVRSAGSAAPPKIEFFTNPGSRALPGLCRLRRVVGRSLPRAQGLRPSQKRRTLFAALEALRHPKSSFSPTLEVVPFPVCAAYDD